MEKFLTKGKPFKRLFKRDDAADFQKSNPFILTGYRCEGLSVSGCVKSLFALHNETLNVWTHLAGFAVFAFLMVRDLFVARHVDNVSTIDVLVLVSTLLSYMSCMLFSAVFHTFGCRSKVVNERCLRLDLAGISLALVASYLSGIYFAFYCIPHWRNFYLASVGGIFIAASLTAQLSPSFVLHVVVFSLWAVYGFVPTAHWVYLHGTDSAVVGVLLPRVIIMYAVCGLAFIVYLTKMPERLWPGKFDVYGHSHQWWHVIIFAALFYWHQFGMDFAVFRVEAGCKSDVELIEHIQRLKIWPF